MKTETLPNNARWFRIADPTWLDPTDPSWARTAGGRWNPPGSYDTLYLNEDRVTARLNLRLFIEGKPYGPHDLRNSSGPCLVTVSLPRKQQVADAHTPAGLDAVGLPRTYPIDRGGGTVPHPICQAVGALAHREGLRGVRCRCAREADGIGRELAWFPATARSRAKTVSIEPYEDWYFA